ncbi:Multidrug resistance protein Fnx1 [Rasamsonia emersonii CBS 393.64]|uniref:Multidrug resistance protein Fnx1 n=1 Tax=Rasamsonia emersonii (strain ATCC 16479 / CBS 393.64 / IMI 116815) TaxID=1408163 RepID=A0A0F4YXJ9_RASE3|nr:Multidrug resistance protein Fnx1 [Rasamsonia emersonii CBS 393.64]KKA22964.1 Multidrug resistance protein Fnx1 [Rasamsonia emersonii CBS 393.64]
MAEAESVDESSPLSASSVSSSYGTTTDDSHDTTTTVETDTERAVTATNDDNKVELLDARRFLREVYLTALFILGEFIANADTSLVFASNARISSEFGELQNANWLSTAYGLGLCAVQPMYGKLSDIYGRKLILLVAYSLFAAGCIICGVAGQMWQVILGRAVTGVGGAGMVTLASVIITDLVPKREVAQWRAYVNISMTLGRSLGGPLGGFLTDSIGWRWLFLIQAPLIGIAALLVVTRLSITHVQPSTTVVDEEDDPKSKLGRIDFAGILFLSTSVISGMLLLDLGGQKFPWLSIYTVGLAVSAVALFVAFVLTEVYIAREPIFALHILRQPNVAASYLVMTLQIVSQVGMMYTIPLYFQITARSSATVAGAHLVPAVVGNALAGLVAGATIKQTGRYKSLIVSAGLIASVTYILLFLRWNGATNFWESLYILPGGIGTGIAQAGSFVSMTSKLQPQDIAMATGGFFLCTSVGVSTGITGYNAAIELEFGRRLRQKLTGKGAEKIINRVLSDASYIKSLHGPVRDIVVSSYIAGLKHTYCKQPVSVQHSQK